MASTPETARDPALALTVTPPSSGKRSSTSPAPGSAARQSSASRRQAARSGGGEAGGGDPDAGAGGAATEATFASLTAELARDSRIHAVLQSLWSVTTGGETDRPASRDEYVLMHKNLQLAMLGSLDERDDAASRQAEADWVTDSKGSGALDWAAFTRAWFQLAARWTDLRVADQCAAFFETLYSRLVKAREGRLEWAWPPSPPPSPVDAPRPRRVPVRRSAPRQRPRPVKRKPSRARPASAERLAALAEPLHRVEPAPAVAPVEPERHNATRKKVTASLHRPVHARTPLGISLANVQWLPPSPGHPQHRALRGHEYDRPEQAMAAVDATHVAGPITPLRERWSEDAPPAPQNARGETLPEDEAQEPATSGDDVPRISQRLQLHARPRPKSSAVQPRRSSVGRTPTAKSSRPSTAEGPGFIAPGSEHRVGGFALPQVPAKTHRSGESVQGRPLVGTSILTGPATRNVVAGVSVTPIANAPFSAPVGTNSDRRPGLGAKPQHRSNPRLVRPLTAGRTEALPRGLTVTVPRSEAEMRPAPSDVEANRRGGSDSNGTPSASPPSTPRDLDRTMNTSIAGEAPTAPTAGGAHFSAGLERTESYDLEAADDSGVTARSSFDADPNAVPASFSALELLPRPKSRAALAREAAGRPRAAVTSELEQRRAKRTRAPAKLQSRPHTSDGDSRSRAPLLRSPSGSTIRTDNLGRREYTAEGDNTSREALQVKMKLRQLAATSPAAATRAQRESYDPSGVGAAVEGIPVRLDADVVGPEVDGAAYVDPDLHPQAALELHAASAARAESARMLTQSHSSGGSSTQYGGGLGRGEDPSHRLVAYGGVSQRYIKATHSVMQVRETTQPSSRARPRSSSQPRGNSQRGKGHGDSTVLELPSTSSAPRTEELADTPVASGSLTPSGWPVGMFAEEDEGPAAGDNSAAPTPTPYTRPSVSAGSVPRPRRTEPRARGSPKPVSRTPQSTRSMPRSPSRMRIIEGGDAASIAGLALAPEVDQHDDGDEFAHTTPLYLDDMPDPLPIPQHKLEGMARTVPRPKSVGSMRAQTAGSTGPGARPSSRDSLMSRRAESFRRPVLHGTAEVLVLDGTAAFDVDGLTYTPEEDELDEYPAPAPRPAAGIDDGTYAQPLAVRIKRSALSERQRRPNTTEQRLNSTVGSAAHYGPTAIAPRGNIYDAPGDGLVSAEAMQYTQPEEEHTLAQVRVLGTPTPLASRPTTRQGSFATSQRQRQRSGSDADSAADATAVPAYSALLARRHPDQRPHIVVDSMAPLLAPDTTPFVITGQKIDADVTDAPPDISTYLEQTNQRPETGKPATAVTLMGQSASDGSESKPMSQDEQTERKGEASATAAPERKGGEHSKVAADTKPTEVATETTSAEAAATDSKDVDEADIAAASATAEVVFNIEAGVAADASAAPPRSPVGSPDAVRALESPMQAEEGRERANTGAEKSAIEPWAGASNAGSPVGASASKRTLSGRKSPPPLSSSRDSPRRVAIKGVKLTAGGGMPGHIDNDRETVGVVSRFDAADILADCPSPAPLASPDIAIRAAAAAHVSVGGLSIGPLAFDPSVMVLAYPSPGEGGSMNDSGFTPVTSDLYAPAFSVDVSEGRSLRTAPARRGLGSSAPQRLAPSKAEAVATPESTRRRDNGASRQSWQTAAPLGTVQHPSLKASTLDALERVSALARGGAARGPGASFFGQAPDARTSTKQGAGGRAQGPTKPQKRGSRGLRRIRKQKKRSKRRSGQRKRKELTPLDFVDDPLLGLPSMTPSETFGTMGKGYAGAIERNGDFGVYSSTRYAGNGVGGAAQPRSPTSAKLQQESPQPSNSLW